MSTAGTMHSVLGGCHAPAYLGRERWGGGGSNQGQPSPFPLFRLSAPSTPPAPSLLFLQPLPLEPCQGKPEGAGGCSLYAPLQKCFPETSVELSVSWAQQFKIQNIWSCHSLPGKKLFCYICCVGKPVLYSNMLVEKKVIQTSAWRVKPILVSAFWSPSCLSLIYSSDSSVITIILKSC